LYLDNDVATFGGWLFGFPKVPALIDGDQRAFQVNRLQDQVLLFTGHSKPSGDPRPPAKFSKFELIRPIFELPVLGHNAAGYLRTRFEFRLQDAQMEPAPLTVHLTADFFAQALCAKKLTVSGIDPDVDVRHPGAFCMTVPWRLNLPDLCGPA
jgi:hypothetical protein